MQLTSRLTALTTAAVMSPLFISVNSTKAAEPPTDVHLTVETKDIDIDEIPEDRVVSLNVYLENCPPYNTLCFGVLKDPRLSFYPWDDCFTIADGVGQAGRASCLRYEDEPDYRYCGTGARDGYTQRVTYDSAIVVISFTLPEQVSAGDFFNVDLTRSYRNETILVSMSQELEDVFSDFPFTQLNNGGIRITQKNAPPPPPENNNSGGGDTAQGGAGQESSGGSQPSDSGNAPAASDGGNGNAPTPTEATATQTVTVTTSVSDTTTTKSETTSEKTTTETTTTVSDTTSSASTSQSTIAAITTGASEEPEKRNAGGLKTIGIITLIVAAISSVTVLAARLRMNKK